MSRDNFLSCADRFFLGQDWYPYYASLPPDQPGPSAYKPTGGRSSCEDNCRQFANSVDFSGNGEAFYCFNQCITQCPDLSRTKSQAAWDGRGMNM